jgi:hypothetical protein
VLLNRPGALNIGVQGSCGAGSSPRTLNSSHHGRAESSAVPLHARANDDACRGGKVTPATNPPPDPWPRPPSPRPQPTNRVYAFVDKDFDSSVLLASSGSDAAVMDSSLLMTGGEWSMRQLVAARDRRLSVWDTRGPGTEVSWVRALEQGSGREASPPTSCLPSC